MKKLLTSFLYFFSIISVFSLSNCKKESTDTFCLTNRTSIASLNTRKGIVIYYQKYNKYAVHIDTSFAGNIDSQVVGLTCNLPHELQAEGINVSVSGQLKKFNSDENISPQMAGDELYYLEIIQIIKK
ncbi:MAG: hypothetical protein ABI091_20320 [Ferruginibacter sp.]